MCKQCFLRHPVENSIGICFSICSLNVIKAPVKDDAWPVAGQVKKSKTVRYACDGVILSSSIIVQCPALMPTRRSAGMVRLLRSFGLLAFSSVPLKDLPCFFPVYCRDAVRTPAHASLFSGLMLRPALLTPALHRVRRC